MKTTTPLSTARATAPIVMVVVMVPLAAHAPERPPSRPSIYTSNANFAVFRDYSNSQVKPCLIGSASCTSAYPPPTPCLVSTQRCSADYRIELADAETR
jgi:hypothetical protein